MLNNVCSEALYLSLPGVPLVQREGWCYWSEETERDDGGPPHSGNSSWLLWKPRVMEADKYSENQEAILSMGGY